MNTWAYTPTTDTAHWYDGFHFLWNMDRWPRKKPCVLETVSLDCRAQTSQLRGLPWKLKNKETWRACHINKTDDITCWKDKHSLFKGYQHTQKKNITSSTFRKHFCQVGKIANITGNTQKQISAYTEYDGAGQELHAARSGALKKWIQGTTKTDRGVSLFVPNGHKNSSDDGLGLRMKAAALAPLRLTKKCKLIAKNEIFLSNTDNQNVLAGTKVYCATPKSIVHYLKSGFVPLFVMETKQTCFSTSASTVKQQ